MGGPPADTLLATHCPSWPTYKSSGQYWATRLLNDSPPGAVTLSVLPTGGGKSLTYLLPLLELRQALHQDTTALVITPTISLMTDQAAIINERYRRIHDWQLQVRELHSLQSTEERTSVLESFERGDIGALFMSPETALTPSFLRRASHLAERIAFLVIDEAHLVADWGAQFRPAYQRLNYLREMLLRGNSRMKTHLMSATVAPEIEEALRQLFQVPKELWRTAKDCPIRTEAHISVEQIGTTREDSRRWLEEHLHQLMLPALIYVTVPDHAAELAKDCREAGILAQAYHGNTPYQRREEIIRGWQDGSIHIVVGTSAFGLGIDKPNVRSVVHLCIPESLDRLYQEIGRAGRDGESCLAVLVSTEEDEQIAYSNSLKLLTVDKLLKRWNDMLHKGVMIGTEDGDPVFVLQEEVVPRYWRPELGIKEAGGRNRSWNEVALNFLQRQGFVQYRGVALTEVKGWLTSEFTPAEAEHFPTIRGSLGGANEEIVLRLKDYRAESDAANEELERLAASRFFTAVSRRYGSKFRVNASFLRAEQGTAEELEALRTVEMDRAREAMKAAIRYARRPAKDRCWRQPFARTYDVAFETCGNCDVCRKHGWTGAAQPPNAPPAPWPQPLGEVQEPLRGSYVEHVVYDGMLGRVTPSGQLRLVPALIKAGFAQFVLPNEYLCCQHDRDGPRCLPGLPIGILHTIENVVAGRSLVERSPTAVFAPNAIGPAAFRALAARLTPSLDGFFTTKMPLLWVLASPHGPLPASGRSFVENRNCRVWSADDIVGDILDYGGRRRRGPSLNVDESSAYGRMVTPPPGDRRRAFWVEPERNEG